MGLLGFMALFVRHCGVGFFIEIAKDCDTDMIKRIVNNRAGSPMVEEMLLVGVAVLMFALLFTLLQDIMNWAIDIIRNFF